MSFPLPIKIAGMGRCLPPRVVTSDDVDALCGLPEGWSAKKNGVKERRWAEPGAASAMGAAAAREAVERAGLRLSDIDLILNASATPVQAIPDGGALLARELGAEVRGTPAFSVHATCLSFLLALDTAAGFLGTGRYKRILIVSTEACSTGLNFNEPESATLMGDAAAAAVVTRTPEGGASRLLAANVKTYGEGASYAEIRGLGMKRHPSMGESTPEDQWFHMEGRNIMRLVADTAPAFFEGLRPGLSKGLGSIACVIPHQASLVALRAMTAFGWPMEKLVTTLETSGNCIAASIPTTLYEAIETGRVHRGDEVLLVGTGAGLTLGGIILTY